MHDPVFSSQFPAHKVSISRLEVLRRRIRTTCAEIVAGSAAVVAERSSATRSRAAALTRGNTTGVKAVQVSQAGRVEITWEPDGTTDWRCVSRRRTRGGRG